MDDISKLLVAVATQFDRDAGIGKGVAAQDLLRDVKRMRLALPAGLRGEGHGGTGGAAHTPWMGIFDPDVTDNPHRGLYIAYIFATDLRRVWLTLQQGVTDLKGEVGGGQRLQSELAERAVMLCKRIPGHLAAGWEGHPDLKPSRSNWRVRAYEAASVIARGYDIADMPPERVVRDDLWRAAAALQHAARERSVGPVDQGAGRLSLEYPGGVQAEELGGFTPRDSGDYVATIKARTQKKSRRHEWLLNEFSAHVQSRGFDAHNQSVHPRDLVLRRGGREWLVEAKVVTRGNATHAVREAVGQLLEYQYFLYSESSVRPRLVALFTASVGAYSPYLEDKGIASVWKTVDGWVGSATAHADGLVGP